ncbi:MAG: hypothetical protein IKZ59_05675, partial [Clostridia bacterium]|nr:hypothetical protein [Clostridia bacterium]
MLEKTIILRDFASVREFFGIAASEPYDIELSLGKKTVNAKNADEVFALDLTKPLLMTAHCETCGELLK